MLIFNILDLSHNFRLQVWKKYVFPRFGINYNTFLRYMKTDVDKLLGQAEKQKEEACISVYEQADLQTEP